MRIFYFALLLPFGVLGGPSGGRNLPSLGAILQGRERLRSADDSKVIGGELAALFEFPFLVSFQRRSLAWAHTCGGTIIDANWVVTAAQCVDGVTNLNNIRVAGAEYSFTEVNGYEQYRGILRAVMHPDYWQPSHYNDIALLELSNPFNFGVNGTVAAVALPTLQQSTPAGTNVTIIGWGPILNGGLVPDKPRKGVMPVVSYQDCRQAYGSSTVADSMICAGYPDATVDSCGEDAGGPLVDPNNTFIGIVSWNFGCSLAGYPSVYTQVSYYIDWINSIMMP